MCIPCLQLFCLFVSLSVIYCVYVQLLVAFVSMNLCVCVFVTVWSSHAVGIHVCHQLSLTLEISYCKANDVYFCLYLKFILFDNACKRKRNHGTRLGNRTLEL